ncbi:helix-turn-helix transcriptional regulator [Streptomyces albireticuli]|uniref:Helix-turn-helix transcriptional regulator n=1 Tax=Streptomyces albireticuli TaxID=1940 RepID=A0A2A2D1D3_9ACTN|nr:helix-turn-helix transcriptional regulator [Streptomyces albireticuli]MCD9140693.1 helix-turn-helix transcriptional regulator [Streptomyces albireticuli]MCD9161345.1 helix-turn-helix transcriptional regulator [Streptomyces albireticuli]MCD9190597.1 helix-turn-helix transcriptional regulator [Streptomyces albireticuli]PAU46278.1 helix-turn-helix transcriptional regulator [Streptomyces albireticuli]
MGDADGTAEVRAALLRMRRGAGLPVAFGGLLAASRQLRISDLSGTATPALRGLAIRPGSGLGGKVAAVGRPLSVTDYHSSHVITHEYDAAVATEGLRSVMAVPVVVRGRVRGVLYGALRRPLPLGDRALTTAVDAARELEQALAVQDEALRLLSVARQPTTADPAMWEEVREAHGELRALAHRVTDPALRQDLLAACRRLALASSGGLRAGGADGGPAGAPRAGLSPREVDVLACVASGATNAGAAERLGLRPETVKSYLRSGMRKLGVHTRLEAVVAARKAGVLP